MVELGNGIVAVLSGCAALVAASLRPGGRKGADESKGEGGKLQSPKSAKAGDRAGAKEGRLPAGRPAEPLQKLYEDICQAFAEEKALGFQINAHQDPASFARLDAKVRKLLSDYVASGHRDYRRYSLFNDLHYVRNLVEMNDDFELMVLCWKKGQGSRVHNHAESHGWLMPLAGTMEESKFLPSEVTSERPADAPALPGVLNATTPCPGLTHTGTARIGPGDVAYINDSQGLHAVRCPDDCPSAEGGITLHLYAPPIRRVKLYEPESNRVVNRTPGFFTIRGKKLRDRK